MGLFKSSPVTKADPAEVERSRGRASDIVDVSTLSWEVVLASLEVDAPIPPDDDGDDIFSAVMGPLGLRHDELPRGYATDGFAWTNVFHGVRHGRPVVMNQGAQASGSKGALVAWVCIATPMLSVEPDDGRLVAEGAVPDPVATVLAGLSSDTKLWKNVHFVGGSDGVVVKRPITSTMHPQGWIYDLWLAERIADLVGTTVLAKPDWVTSSLPYGLDKARAK